MRGCLLVTLVLAMACGAPAGGVDGGTCETQKDWGRGGAEMFPGTDCLSCHVKGGRASSRFSSGGTVFASTVCPTPAQDTVVVITDATGATARLDVNTAGNFYTTQALEPPFQVALEAHGRRVEMKASAPGGCGSCHRSDSALGQLVAP